MKFTSTVATALLAHGAAAFPNVQAGSATKTSAAPATSSSYTAVFDPKSQFVDVSGVHAWKAPGPSDVRGPCPGLNAMANHGYLPRSGYALITDLTLACTTVFSMGEDLAAILAAYGGVFDGLGVGWSIGGGYRVGIGGSHNNYESDSSPTRGDLHQYGSNTALVLSQFKELYDMQPDPATANYDINVIKAFRASRYDQSVSNNPVFFYGPFAGPGVTAAAHSFITRFMSNHSVEHPDGLLNKPVLKSFFSIYGPEDNLTWVPGHERIPENWYKRSPNDAYGVGLTLPTPASGRSLSSDTQFFCRERPEICQSGCNTGTTNSFVALNASDNSGGAYSDEDVLANPFCFAIAFANAKALDQIPIVSLVNQELLLPIQNLFGCRTIPKLNETVMEACPGYSQYGGPTGDVAPGAKQF